MGVFWLSLFFLCSVHHLESGGEALENVHGGIETGKTCETINVNLCAPALPYNVTRLPNSFGHITQQAVNDSLYARAQEFNVICSDLMLFFVCTIHLPICIGDSAFRGIIEPCRSVCEKVKADCNATLHRNSVKWPDDREFMCERLPVYNESMCIRPEAFVQSPTVGPSTGLDVDSVCSSTGRRPRPRLTKDLLRRANFDFAFSGSIMSIKRTGDGTFSIELIVYRVIIKKNPTHSNLVRIWSPSNCSCYGVKDEDCAILEEGKKYFMIGHKDATQDRLSVERGFILMYPRDRKVIENIKKWNAKLHKKKD